MRDRQLKIFTFTLLMLVSISTQGWTDPPPTFCPTCDPFTCEATLSVVSSTTKGGFDFFDTAPFHTLGVAGAELWLRQGTYEWLIEVDGSELDAVDPMELPPELDPDEPLEVEAIFLNDQGHESESVFCDVYRD